MQVMHEKRLREIETILGGYYDMCAEKARSNWAGTGGRNSEPLESINPSSNGYKGLWPDDFEFILLGGQVLDVPQYQRLLQFCTDSVVDLTHFPDCIAEDGMPWMAFGGDYKDTGYKMSPALPSAWIRLLTLMESRGAVIPQKEKWAALFIRSIAQTEFSCGLVYVSPNRPHITYPFHDTVAITGFELMSSVVTYRGFILADKLFADCVDAAVRRDWLERAENIRRNLYRLYDEEQGIFLAGSYDNRQADVWGSGLAYALAEPDQKAAMGRYFLENRDRIFREGMTRQTDKPEGWSRMIIPFPAGDYMNGGYWSTGTGFVLPAVYDQNPELAMELLEELVLSLPKYEFAESVNMETGKITNSGFMMGIALPLVAVRAILDEKQLLDVI